jgi:hypothetical protein
MSWTPSRRRSRRLGRRCCVLFLFSSYFFLAYGGLGERRLSGGLERWFSPRGQAMAFLLSRIGLVRPRSEMIKIKSKKMERWRMLLQPYMGQMSFVHKAGKLDGNVDALSRLPRETDPGEERSPRRRDEGGGQSEGTGSRRGDGGGQSEGKVFFSEEGMLRRKAFRWDDAGSDEKRE